MPLNIKVKQTYEMARKLAELTGQIMTRVVRQALQRKLLRVEKAKNRKGLADKLDQLALYCASLLALDARSDDEIIGYDEFRLPK